MKCDSKKLCTIRLCYNYQEIPVRSTYKYLIINKLKTPNIPIISDPLLNHQHFKKPTNL